jgi:hypothetical protein
MIVQFENGLQSATLQLASIVVRNSSNAALVRLQLTYVISSPSIRLRMIVIPPGHHSHKHRQHRRDDNHNQKSETLFDSSNTASTARASYNKRVACGTFRASTAGVYRAILIAEKIRFTNDPVFAYFSVFTVSDEPCSMGADEIKSSQLPTEGYLPSALPMTHYIPAIYKQHAGRDSRLYWQICFSNYIMNLFSVRFKRASFHYCAFVGLLLSFCH